MNSLDNVMDRVSEWQRLFEIVKNDDLEHALLDPAAAARGYGPRQVTLGMVAAEGGANRILRYLLTDLKIDPNARSADGKTSLMFAASVGNELAVEMLLAAKCDVNTQDAIGMSALMYVARFRPANALGLSRQLIQHGASRKLVDFSGRTAAQIAETVSQSVHPDDMISVYYPVNPADPLVALLAEDSD
jgi:ankyrin repeat protein